MKIEKLFSTNDRIFVRWSFLLFVHWKKRIDSTIGQCVRLQKKHFPRQCSSSFIFSDDQTRHFNVIRERIQIVKWIFVVKRRIVGLCHWLRWWADASMDFSFIRTPVTRQLIDYHLVNSHLMQAVLICQLLRLNLCIVERILNSSNRLLLFND